MARVHLMELEDQDWFPAIWRSFGTDILQFNQTAIDQTEPIVEKLAGLAEATGAERFVDLCSGASGPWALMVDRLAEKGYRLPVLLTDKFPNRDSCKRVCDESGGRIEMRDESVDALAVPVDLTGIRTLMNGFHHFRPEQARAILEDAVRKRQPIGTFELVQRTPLAIMAVILGGLVVTPIITLLIRPFRWSRILFTFLIPVIPLLVLWDGLVSCLRVYSPKELEVLCRGLESDDYKFEIGTLANPKAPIPITYLIGGPKPFVPAGS